MGAPQGRSVRICPKCEAPNDTSAIVVADYRCDQCGFELAHLDIAPNGSVRGVFGWLREEGDTVEERYRVKSVLGRGGFGATYLVEDLRLNGKRRALKEVPELLFDEYETALLSRLSHPSIPDIVDRAVENGMVYLVLEFGGSRTLGSERKLNSGRIPLAKLLPWMHQLCEVLMYLHSQNPPIIHRDLKPENVLIDDNDRIMLIDFGIAKEATPSSMTRTLGRAATHGFSPPEQAMGTGTDERSDIYALGATFYALLTGQNPPAAHERVAGKEIVPPSTVIKEIPRALEEALLRSLSLNVNHRQQSVAEFTEVLNELEFGTATPSLRTGAFAERTVLVTQAPPTASTTQRSLKIPSRPTGARTTSSAAGQAHEREGVRWWAYAIGVAVLLSAVGSAAFLLWPEADRGGPADSVSAPVDNAVAPFSDVSAPEKTPSVSATAAFPRDRVTPSGEGQPTHEERGPGAMDIIQQRRASTGKTPSKTGSTVKPAPRTRVSAERAISKPPSRSSAYAPVRKSTSGARSTRSSARPAKSAPTWNIVPQGARKTD